MLVGTSEGTEFGLRRSFPHHIVCPQTVGKRMSGMLSLCSQVLLRSLGIPPMPVLEGMEGGRGGAAERACDQSDCGVFLDPRNPS